MRSLEVCLQVAKRERKRGNEANCCGSRIGVVSAARQVDTPQLSKQSSLQGREISNLRGLP